MIARKQAAIFAASIAATAMAGGLGMDDWAKMPATRHVFSMSCKVTACNGDLSTPEGRAKAIAWWKEHGFTKLAGGVRHQLVLDLDAVQPDGEWCAWRIGLRGVAGGRPITEVQTVPGAPGVLRYVFAFTPPKDGSFPASCNLVFNYVSPRSRFRVAGLHVLCG